MNKHLRKNYYKNSTAKKRNLIKHRFISAIKIAGLVSFLSMMSFVFIFGYDFLTQCEYFKTESINIIGADFLSENDVVDQAKIKKGMNILSVNLSLARKRLLTHSWIADAEVSRELPSGINIRIKEQRPLAILNLGRKFLINDNGEIFKEKMKSDPDNITIVNGLKFSDISVPGKPRSIPFAAIMEVLALGQKPGSILPNRLIKRIKVDREIGLTLFAFDEAKVIKLGYNNYPSKYERLEKVLFYLKRNSNFPDFEWIDLNNLNRIVVNPVRIKSPAEGHKEV